ncbi:cryptochrome DASH [Halolactibacillus alkaliphilus]|uniref:Cryptochrome DASH n=2 Tax=Halolactibacillus alkaliphilus TaxID=442899 RepID=A0A511X0U2_9BACI|nr:DASH family cryptochrome [Halolactibacillus alkaliphilus]GEN56572.1 cryptochrome DASH [Halolactibacillus alkaliphilus]GGN69218.1 cryptochrome DASH [Halolactibacillus alkaliphilus]SFO75327.1 deoxyribodipyrimidine photo-lyase (single-stranded DNA-specific) [Halolactibacillus alkaliphilus]
MKAAVVWFRNDLRVHDHEPLLRASQSGLPVVGVYCFDPRSFQTTHFGFPKTGPHRERFLIESIKNLRENMAKIGLSLIVKIGKPEEVIFELSCSIDIEKLYYHEEIGSEEKAVEVNLKSRFLSTAFYSYYGHNLYHIEDLPFEIDALPDVFTNFRKMIENKASVRPMFPTPRDVKSVPIINDGIIPSDNVFNDTQIQSDRVYLGGASEGKKRLKHYFFDTNLISLYKETRNGMLEIDDSSKLSPYLAHGCLSPRFIYWQLKEYEKTHVKNSSTYWLYFELLWRDFFWLVHFKFKNKLFNKGGLYNISIPWSTNKEMIDAWINGQTGYPLIDANMLELKTTGYMSNRGRQNVASFLTKNLGCDWRFGAEWFESCLIDYDVSSNYGNWCYSAGVGNDSRGFRVFNVAKQGKDYDREAKYAKKWLPALKEVPSQYVYDIHKLTALELLEYNVSLGLDYPQPMVDLSASAQRQRKDYEKALDRGGEDEDTVGVW